MKYIPRSWTLLKRNLKYSSLKPLLNWFEVFMYLNKKKINNLEAMVCRQRKKNEIYDKF